MLLGKIVFALVGVTVIVATLSLASLIGGQEFLEPWWTAIILTVLGCMLVFVLLMRNAQRK